MFYPVMINLDYFNILVIGGGKVAYRKVSTLLRYGGRVVVLSKKLDDDFKNLIGQFIWIEDHYKEESLEGATLVVAATNDQKLNATIGNRCLEKGVLCNVVSFKELSSFIVPASVRRGDLVLSVSTQGKSPMLAQRIKKELEEKYDERYESYVKVLGKAREDIKTHVKDEKVKKEMIKALVVNEEVKRN